MPAQLWRPASGSGPGLLLLQEIFGVSGYIRRRAADLAEAGYVVLAPELYWRLDAGPVDESAPGAIEEAMGLAQRLDWATTVTDAVAALGALRARDEVVGGTGVIGFCFGGGLAFNVAAVDTPDVLVSYYGSALPGLLDLAPAGHGTVPAPLRHRRRLHRRADRRADPRGGHRRGRHRRGGDLRGRQPRLRQLRLRAPPPVRLRARLGAHPRVPRARAAGRLRPVHFVGVDLAWGRAQAHRPRRPRRRRARCVHVVGGRTDDEIVRGAGAVRRRATAWSAIDAPLVVTNATGNRPARGRAQPGLRPLRRRGAPRRTPASRSSPTAPAGARLAAPLGPRHRPAPRPGRGARSRSTRTRRRSRCSGSAGR